MRTVTKTKRQTKPTAASRRKAKPLDIRWLTERALPQPEQLPENPVLVLRCVQ